MANHRWLKLGVPLAVALLTAGCGGALPGAPGVDLPTASCGKFDLAARTVGDFGTTDAATKLEKFLAANMAAYGLADDVANDVTAACKEIGLAIGITEDRLGPQGEGAAAKVRGACGVVATDLRTYVEQTLPAGSTFVLAVQPPACAADMQVVARAAAECDANVSAEAQVECQGKLSGQCSGRCTGSCSGQCEGQCSGTCSGQCSGTCNGVCDGRCARRGADGQCAGRCRGTCQGQCTAECTGSCSADCTGSCGGSCTGECSVEFEAPRCEGEAQVEASVECRAEANLRAQAEVTCTPAVVKLAVSPAPAGAADERIATLIAALEAGLPKLLTAIHRLESSLGPTMRTYGDATAAMVSSLGNVATEIGAEAAMCLTSAGRAVLDAQAMLSGSLEVSIEIRASVSVQGQAGASAGSASAPPHLGQF